MKYLGMALAAAGLLIQASGAYAISFAPPRSLAVPEAEKAAGPWTVGLAATSWKLPSSGGVSFKSKVRPLLTVEYQVDPKLAIGGWVNALSWDATATTILGPLTANVDGTIWELHGTYGLPKDFAVQLGYQQTDVDLKFGGTSLGKISDNAAVLWGLKSFELQKTATGGLGALLGLGVQQPLKKHSGSLAAQGQLGLSYAFNPRLSVDASAWFSDFTRKDSSTVRYSAGLTGRF